LLGSAVQPSLTAAFDELPVAARVACGARQAVVTSR
jgi:hypothetical protein